MVADINLSAGPTESRPECWLCIVSTG